MKQDTRTNLRTRDNKTVDCVKQLTDSRVIFIPLEKKNRVCQPNKEIM